VASEVDIANLALGHLGDDANVASFDPPEGSPQAAHCARFYPIARDTMLEMHPWSFATTTAALAPLGDPPSEWFYSYALPTDCLKPLSTYTLGYRLGLDAQPFELESTADGQPVIFTNCDAGMLRYVRRVADPTRFSPLFTEALSWLLASMLAGPVIKGDTGTAAGTAAYKVFLMRFGEAARVDANKSRIRLDPVAPWIVAR
jgi:hypothetical protein